MFFIGVVEVKYNPLGYYLRSDGKIFKDENCITEVIPKTDEAGYKYIEKDGDIKYVHRMMVFTFGDCKR